MRAIGFTIIVISAAVLLLHSAQEYLAIDACLDSGRVFDYRAGECRSDLSRVSYIPYLKRFSWVNTGALLAMLLGIAFVIIASRKKP